MKKTLLSLLVPVLFLSLTAAAAHDEENPDQASSDLIYKHFD